MTKKLFQFAFALVVPALAGCTSHYREALLEYRQGEPLPFYQRTLEWASEAEDDAPAPAAIERRAAEEDIKPADLPTPADKHLEVAARVLGVSPDGLAGRWPASDIPSRPSTGETEGARSYPRGLGERVDFEELMVAVAALNPEVQAAREEWRAMLYQYDQAQFLEGLLREYRTFTRYLDVGAGEPMQREMMQEFFPSPSTVTFRGEMVREEARLAELEWERVLREALVEAGTSFFDYQFQHRGAATVEENILLLDNLLTVVQDRYATGLASQVDVLRLQTELERQRNLLRDFESRRVTSAAQLNALLGRPAGARLGRPADNDLPYRVSTHEALVEAARAHRQEILMQEARIARTAIALRMGEVMNRPLFSQGYTMFDRGMMPETFVGEEPMPFASQPGAPAPRPGYAQAEAYLAELRQRLEAERAMLDQTVATTSALARALLEQADIAQRQAALIRDIVLPLTQSAYEIALRGYTAGDMSFIDLLDAERELIDARLELDESRRDQNEALVRLATARGFFVQWPPD
jgi:outer membrane protein, heavy metal efflux system